MAHAIGSWHETKTNPLKSRLREHPMKKAYLYPITARDTTQVFNPYLQDFMHSLKDHISFVNSSKPSGSGVFDMLKYLNEIDYIFFNWPENIPDKKLGKVQTLFLFMLFRIFSRKNIKTIYTLHNKIAHSKANFRIKQKINRLMLKKSDVILTHAQEGVKYAQTIVKDINPDKIFFSHHPINDKRDKISQLSKTIDVLLWGSLHPYKGIDKFLDYLHGQKKANKFKIVIAGKVMDDTYLQVLKPLLNENIRLINKFVSDDELHHLVAQSKRIVFTYSGESVLSSGALIDSVAFGANVAGPAKSAFKDLKDEGVIENYSNWQELVRMLEHSPELNMDGINSFIENNSWNIFGEKFNSFLCNIK